MADGIFGGTLHAGRLVLAKKLGRRVPGSIVVIIVAGAIATWLHLDGEPWKIQTLGSTFGVMPSHLPVPHWPGLSFEQWLDLVPQAMTVAVLAIDATGLDALEDLHQRLSLQRKALILCGPHSQPLFALTRAGSIDKLGQNNVCGDLSAAVDRARELIRSKNLK